MIEKKENFPNRIRYWRKIRKLTQEELGEQTGLQKQQISRLETGERHVYLHRLRSIARVLNVNTADLLSEEDNPLIMDSEVAQIVQSYKEASAEGRAAICSVAEVTTRFKTG